MNITIGKYRHVIEMHCLYRTSGIPKVTNGMPITEHGILGKGNFNTLYFDTPDFDLLSQGISLRIAGRVDRKLQASISLRRAITSLEGFIIWEGFFVTVLETIGSLKSYNALGIINLPQLCQNLLGFKIPRLRLVAECFQEREKMALHLSKDALLGFGYDAACWTLPNQPNEREERYYVSFDKSLLPCNSSTIPHVARAAAMRSKPAIKYVDAKFGPLRKSRLKLSDFIEEVNL
ncbi:hypothetical protein COK72_14140 [Bacillus thuringiensis]|uniref:Uncharacterized protein n=3 Tax=Bacillus cereus group TaxID=86661 RepID=A0A9X7AMW2_BACTU|nr:hypothetical protein COK72_14140 [Bacillus thuringiensis]